MHVYMYVYACVHRSTAYLVTFGLQSRMFSGLRSQWMMFSSGTIQYDTKRT